MKRTKLNRWPKRYRQQIRKALERSKPLVGVGWPVRRRNKYNAQPQPAPLGERLGFASKDERDRYQQLKILERAGIISDVKRQQEIILTKARISYTADATYIEDGVKIVEDYKGFIGERFRVIMQLWRVYGPAVLRVVTRAHGAFIVCREIPKGRSK